MTSLIFPPAPPTKNVFGPSDFEYVSKHDRTFIKDAYEVISRKELWNTFRNELLSKGVNRGMGFMYSENPVYKKIKMAIASTDIGGRHSGSSMGHVMREMEFIALNGEPAYRIEITRQIQTAQQNQIAQQNQTAEE